MDGGRGTSSPPTQTSHQPANLMASHPYFNLEVVGSNPKQQNLNLQHKDALGAEIVQGTTFESLIPYLCASITISFSKSIPHPSSAYERWVKHPRSCTGQWSPECSN